MHRTAAKTRIADEVSVYAAANNPNSFSRLSHHSTECYICAMAIYETRWFSRWARKQGLTAVALCAAVREMTAGLVDADLGGGLLKKRVARPGHGKSGGFRTLVATNRGDRWVFVFGFAKSVRDNIGANEEEALKKLAIHLLSLSAQGIERAKAAGELMEVESHGEEPISDS